MWLQVNLDHLAARYLAASKPRPHMRCHLAARDLAASRDIFLLAARKSFFHSDIFHSGCESCNFLASSLPKVSLQPQAQRDSVPLAKLTRHIMHWLAWQAHVRNARYLTHERLPSIIPINSRVFVKSLLRKMMQEVKFRCHTPQVLASFHRQASYCTIM